MARLLIIGIALIAALGGLIYGIDSGEQHYNNVNIECRLIDDNRHHWYNTGPRQLQAVHVWTFQGKLGAFR